MNALEAQIHRTWVQLLFDSNYKEIAAIAVDSEIRIFETENWNNSYVSRVAIGIATKGYALVNNDDHIQEVMLRAIKAVCIGCFTYDSGDIIDTKNIHFEFQIKPIEVEDGWQNVIRSLIANAESPNQGLVSEKLALRGNRQHYTYNEMKFASKSEIRIAQEFETRGVLFFPLPLAVRAETGEFYKDHREPDFLMCHDGVWGILEVSYHPDRYERDKEKDAWFKQSGILCIEHYTAERCYNQPSEVVDEFLGILAKHKK